MNATTINKCVFTPGIKVIPAKAILAIITKMVNSLYSAFKKANAPS